MKRAGSAAARTHNASHSRARRDARGCGDDAPVDTFLEPVHIPKPFLRHCCKLCVRGVATLLHGRRISVEHQHCDRLSSVRVVPIASVAYVHERLSVAHFHDRRILAPKVERLSWARRCDSAKFALHLTELPCEHGEVRAREVGHAHNVLVVAAVLDHCNAMLLRRRN